MKKVILFFTLLFLAGLPKLLKSRDMISSFMSMIPTTPIFLSCKNSPFAIGMASGTFFASALTNQFNGKKGYKEQPKETFGTVLAGINKINTIL